jgi:2'-5' RNA ligase
VDGVMIALLPTSEDWAKADFPHMTLVYAGKTQDLGPTDFNDLAKDASMLASLSSPITLRVKGKEVFGDGTQDNPSVDVFTLQATPELWAMRRAVEKWNASKFPFNPHVTIGPQGTFVEFPPRYIGFDRVVVGWGEEYLTFALRR